MYLAEVERFTNLDFPKRRASIAQRLNTVVRDATQLQRSPLRKRMAEQKGRARIAAV